MIHNRVKMANENLPEQPGGVSAFESIKRVSKRGIEYWSSRDLAAALSYADYANFERVVRKAREACFNSGIPAEDHFRDGTEMVDIGSRAKREIAATYMTRYGCYLAIQNADPTKPNVASGQTYFAVQTRRQEIADEQTDDQRRLMLRHELREHNKALSAAAKDAGVIEPFEYATFQDHGYKGLYGGLGARDIHQRKGLKKSEQILDHMGSTELAANLFRATQTEEKLKREQIKGKEKANKAHFDVGKKVRQTIEELQGTMPEELPAEPSIRKLEAKLKKELPDG